MINKKYHLLLSTRMKDVLLLLGILLVFGIISFIVFYPKTSKDDDVNVIEIKDKVRCPPKVLDARKPPLDYDIKLYEESNHIKNKGFENELIYKPEQSFDNVHFVSGITKNDVPLNMDDDETIDSSLPIANINVCYLLNNSTKLQ
jgi:hypothetical protein